jgi:hypothetical protein
MTIAQRVVSKLAARALRRRTMVAFHKEFRFTNNSGRKHLSKQIS